MNNYIKREDALNALRDYPVTKLKTAIRRLPSADVAPVRHGRWTTYKETAFADYANCSECGTEINVGDMSPYCPNCGARMDGDENETD